jgi:signal transduction histidine kinase
MANASAAERKVTIRGPSRSHAVIMKTDPEIVKAILQIFISNAIHYSKPGQKVILYVKDESRAYVFTVRDFGIGILKAECRRVFERFYRGAHAKQVRPAGMGLGLHFARMLAERIGAEVSLVSHEGEGSVFSLRIPKNSRSRKAAQHGKIPVSRIQYV